MYKVFIFLGLLVLVYVLPYVVVASALIRLMFRLNTNPAKMILSLLFALPLIAALQFGTPVLFPSPGHQPDTVAKLLLWGALALTMVGSVFWWLGQRDLKVGRYWIEVFLFVGIAAIQLYSVDNWIAH